MIVGARIMHRDIKLANLFLHDGDIVIGDFGFARIGVEIARTQLGTPSTMAPEMLLPNGNAEYDNKADLWSIGVVFYQMLFGVNPFEPTNFTELKTRIQTHSGENLVFPPRSEVTEDTKALLRSLIEVNPKKRLEWSDFFACPLLISDLKVKSLPLVNENHARAEERKPRASSTLPDKRQQPESTEQEEKHLQKIRYRFHHEKKRLVFMIDTVKRLVKLSKDPELSREVAERALLAGVVLARKAFFENASVAYNVKNGIN